MAANGQRGHVVLGAIDHPGLQAGIHLAIGHRRGGGAQRLDHGDGGRALLHTDLQPAQIVRRVDRALGVEAAGTGVVVSEPDEATVARRGQDLFTHGAGQGLEEMILVTEHERQVEHLVIGREGFQRRGAGLGDLQDAVLHLFKHLALGAQNAVREDRDLDFALAVLLGQLGKLHHRLVHRMVFRLVVPQAHFLGRLGVEPEGQQQTSEEGCVACFHSMSPFGWRKDCPAICAGRLSCRQLSYTNHGITHQ